MAFNRDWFVSYGGHGVGDHDGCWCFKTLVKAHLRDQEELWEPERCEFAVRRASRWNSSQICPVRPDPDGWDDDDDEPRPLLRQELVNRQAELFE